MANVRFLGLTRDNCNSLGAVCDIAVLNNLTMVSRSGRTLFMESLMRKKAAQLLELVDLGNQDAAVALFSKKPELLFTPIDTTNPSSTVWNFVQTVRDIPMIYGFLNSLPKLPNGKLTPTADLIRQELAKRYIPNVESNLTELRKSGAGYAEQSQGKSSKEQRQLLIELVGKPQASLPANVWQLMAKPEGGFINTDFTELTQHRNMQYFDDDKGHLTAYPTTGTGIGETITLIPRLGIQFLGEVSFAPKPERIAAYMDAIIRLDETRTKQMQDLGLILQSNTLTLPKVEEIIVAAPPKPKGIKKFTAGFTKLFKKKPESKSREELYNADLNTIAGF